MYMCICNVYVHTYTGEDSFCWQEGIHSRVFYISKTWKALSIQYSLPACITSNVQLLPNRALAITNPWALHCSLLNSQVYRKPFQSKLHEKFCQFACFSQHNLVFSCIQGSHFTPIRKGLLCFHKNIGFLRSNVLSHQEIKK